jgi:RNA polymerase sigma-70 factor (ECF subfamily)
VEVEERLAAGCDRRAEDQLIDLMDRYEQPLRGFLLVLLRDQEIALDCAQDTFIRAYENLRKGRQVNAQWLYKVARNRAMDEFRRKRRIHAGMELLQDRPGDHPDVSVETATVRRVLDQLSPEDREVLYLFVFDRFKTAEIATMLGIGAGAVRTRLYRARERFRLLYGDAT